MVHSGASFNRVAMRLVLAGAALVIGISTASVGIAGAEPSSPAPGPTTTSSDDELTDMVMDAVQNGAAAPSTTPAVPAPH
jgi:hypothetical protein